MQARQMVGYTAAFYPRWDDSLVSQLVRQWDVPWDERVGTLSTGQKQKLALVMALGHRPELLILDEPVGSLDPVSRREFLKSLVHLTSDGQHTVLFSTHITSDLERVATHVAILRDGKIEYYNALDELKEQVKRIRITADAKLPASLQVPGALRVEVDGCDALVAVAKIDDELIEDLRQRWKARITVEDLNLEEIYLEVHDA
jgi:ABC-2 type transport system ATP-binding protein